MAFTDAIVSYTNLVQPFGTQANLIAQTQKVAAKVITDPAKLNSTMSDFTDGLNAWQKAEIQPRVFHTPCHPMGSLVQSTSWRRPIWRTKSSRSSRKSTLCWKASK
jgi:hypothetical protein